jgi:hypothetical protein
MDSLEEIDVYIPIQNLESSAIVISAPVSIYPMKLPVAILSYKTPIYTIPRLKIFTKNLVVQTWDPIKFRLELADNDNFKELIDLQETIISSIHQHPEWSGCNNINIEEVRTKFQPIICKNLLTLYINLNSLDKILIYSTNDIKKGVSHDSFQQGQQIRVALNFQGLLFLKNSHGNLFYRLQHQISTIYIL